MLLPFCRGEFGHRPAAVNQHSQNFPPRQDTCAEHLVEGFVEFPQQETARQEAQSPEILVYGQFGTNLLKILGDPAGKRKDIEFFSRRKPIT